MILSCGGAAGDGGFGGCSSPVECPVGDLTPALR